jgi:1,4-alpha-glucan branching enzyme
MKKIYLLLLLLTSYLGAEAFNVTFSVDMQNVTGFTTPEVNGTFNGWCGNCNAMSDADGDNIWEVTLNLPEGNYEYKFAHDAWTGQENLNSGSSCTVTNNGFTNRSLNLTGDVVLDAVCWGSCTACSVQPSTYNVTFQVDMSQETFSFTEMQLNGTFNNWCGACAPMSDANGDNIWEITIPLEAGSYEFKYAYDNWTG